jgi:membrane protein insertase Oxa1/YidC/SpoIIIJ
MLFKIGTKNSLTKTAYISRRKQSFARSLIEQVANSIGNKKQSSGKLQQNMTKHPLNNINGCLIEINMMKITI